MVTEPVFTSAIADCVAGRQVPVRTEIPPVMQILPMIMHLFVVSVVPFHMPVTLALQVLPLIVQLVPELYKPLLPLQVLPLIVQLVPAFHMPLSLALQVLPLIVQLVPELFMA
jgi:hypothetical protein